MSTASIIILFVILPIVMAALCMPFGVFLGVFKKKNTVKFLKLQPFEQIFLDYKNQQSLKFGNYTKQDIKITSYDKLKLFAEYYDFGSDKTVILIHGFRDCPQKDFPYIAAHFAEKGYNFLACYQRGQNCSGGLFSAMGLKERYDVLSWIDYLKKNTDTKKIVIYGLSMGAATAGFASCLIKSPLVKTIIMDSGFVCPIEEMDYTMKSNRNMAGLVLGSLKLLGKLLLRVDFKERVDESLKKNTVPTIFLHGLGDIIVPISCSEINYNANASEKLFIKVPDAGHEKAFIAGGDEIRGQIFNFIQKFVEDEK